MAPKIGGVGPWLRSPVSRERRVVAEGGEVAIFFGGARRGGPRLRAAVACASGPERTECRQGPWPIAIWIFTNITLELALQFLDLERV